MSETITITEAETGPEAPQEEAQDNQSERPEWLPEKFKTPEDLAKSYSELEKNYQVLLKKQLKSKPLQRK